MLSVLKNNLISETARRAIDLHRRELEWYTNNYWILVCQATILAGFAFQRLQDANTIDMRPFYLFGTLHVSLTAFAMMTQLYVITAGMICCVWAPGLALRGAKGMQSARDAVTVLATFQNGILCSFLAGLLAFIASSIVLVAGLSLSDGVINRSILVTIATTIVICALLTRTVKTFYYDRPTVCTVYSVIQTETLGDLDNTVVEMVPEDMPI